MRVLVFALSLVLAASAAMAQPAPTPLPVPATLPDAAGIPAVCGVIPATPPVLTPAARGQALNLTLRAGGAHSRNEFATAVGLYWQTFVVTRELAPLVAITGDLQGLGAAEQPRLCALLACVISRTPEGAERAELVQRQTIAHCSTQTATQPNVPLTPPVGPNPPAQQFMLNAAEFAAVQVDSDLVADIRRAENEGFLIGINHEWYVPVRFRARVTAALERHRATLRVLNPPRAGRSVLGYALPIAGWVAGAGLLAGALVTGLRCNEANAELARANAGMTNGWPRQAEADAINNCMAFNVLLPAAIVAAGGGTAAWFALAPPNGPTLTPSVSSSHAGLNLTLPFRLF